MAMLKQLYPFYSVIRREHGDPLIEELNPGDALEPEGRGTGKAPEGFSSSAQHSSQPWGGRIKNSGSQSHPQVRIGKSPGPGDRRHHILRAAGGGAGPVGSSSFCSHALCREMGGLRNVPLLLPGRHPGSGPSPPGNQLSVRQRAVDWESRMQVCGCSLFWVLISTK